MQGWAKNVNEPALLELFTCLRTAGLPLGVAEYYLLLRAVDAGFGTSDRAALEQLCCTLWIKSAQEEQIFQAYFDQLFPVLPEPVSLPVRMEVPDSNSLLEVPSVSEKRRLGRVRHFILLGLAICFAAVSGTVLTILRDTGAIRFGDDLTNGALSFEGIPFLPLPLVAKEDQGTVSVTVVRTGSQHGAVSVALVPEVAGDPLSSVDTTPHLIQWAEGEVKKTVKIPIINDNKYELGRSVTLRLTDPQGGATLGDRPSLDLLIQEDDSSFDQAVKVVLDRLEHMLIGASFIFLLLIGWRVWKHRQIQSSEDEGTSLEKYTNLSKTMLSPEVIRAMANEPQAARSVRQAEPALSDLFPLILNDLPVTPRQMKQGWRYLRQFTRQGAAVEMDLEATIQQVSQQGVLLNPVMVPARTNQLELLLLIDRDGSMVPFHHLSQGLIDTAIRGGRFNRVRVYYFHNCPDDYLYRDPYHLEAELLDDCLLNLSKTRTVCMIFSDAGAARGGYSSKRRRRTKSFLKQLGQYVRTVAWLNPLPRRRWDSTTAKEIAAWVPMFEVNRQGLYQAIDALKGRSKTLAEGRR
jgi:uncharacterized protein with von Willebrand factor type A (vWA) domain